MGAGDPVFVSLLAVLETEWVLRSSAGFDKTDIVEAFKALLEARDIALEHELILEHALALFENSNADFAECLMIAHYQRLGCSATLTFDAKASRLSDAERLAT